MSPEKKEFAEFLSSLKLETGLIKRFEAFHTLLSEQNTKINLISRAEHTDSWWTKHFLDSLLPLNCLDLSVQKALDFGSGGGLPGIPLKLACPGLRFTLLDSIGKKTRALQEMVDDLKLNQVKVINERLEDHARSTARYDLIFCRAVKMEPRYRQALYRLLDHGGRVIFFKAMEHADLAEYQPKCLLQIQFSWGFRSLWEVKRKALAF